MKRFLRLSLIGLLPVVLCPVLAATQSADPKVYAPVPKHLRARLVERLNQYISLEADHDYEKLYELFSEKEVAYLKSLGWGSKSEWVKFMGDGTLALTPLDFTPTLIKKRGAGEFVISGRLRSTRGPHIDVDEGSIRAYRERGDWYFSELGIEIY